ncbi:MAG TPA: lactate utilization protein [Anaerolineae bacterium]|nr:lactate utilization protein [Anaerolineae bacterium]
MTDRDKILATLRQQTRAVSYPPAWQSRRQFDDLAQRFDASLTAAHGEVLRAGSLDEALDVLSRTLVELSAQRVAINAEPPLDGIDLVERWPGIEWRVAGQEGKDLRAFCAVADAGVTGVDAALAETGAIVVSSGPGKSRLVPLLPPVHIALAPSSRLTTDLFTWTAVRGGAMPSSVTLISGPSKTADIEQTMAIGVHGPKRLIVILYQDS